MTPGPLPSWPETPVGLDFLSSLSEYKNSTKGQIFFLVCHLGKRNRRMYLLNFYPQMILAGLHQRGRG